MYDMHIHSVFSPDAVSTAGEYAALIDRGVAAAAGFAEHLDFLPECGAYGFLDYSSYIGSINEYKQMGYDFYAGAEVDYAKSVEDEITGFLSRQRFDFTICSVHMINGISISDGRNTAVFLDPDAGMDILEKYYYEVSAGLKVSQFDAVGHIGIYGRYLEPGFFDAMSYKNKLNEMNNELARECARSGKIIEVNSSGLFSPCKSTIPSADFLKSYFEYGGIKVCMGSDSHVSHNLARGFDTVISILKAIGFHREYLPWDPEKPVLL